MLLEKLTHRIKNRSTEELVIDELIELRSILKSSKVIEKFECNRAKRGRRKYDFIQLLLLYLWMESKKTTFRGVLRNLNDHDCKCLGFVKHRGHYDIPSLATLNHFVNHVLPEVFEDLSIELSESMIASSSKKVYTIDSTPLEASKFSSADFNTHYNCRMDKAHMIMINGFPLIVKHTRGNAADAPVGRELVKELYDIKRDIECKFENCELLADGSYANFEMHADVFYQLKCLIQCRYPEDSAFHHEADEKKILNAYASLFKHDDYDMNRKNDIDYVLRFLYRHGKKILVGKYLWNIGLHNWKEDQEKEESEQDRRRWICETVHKAAKCWIDFNVKNLRVKTKETRIKCKFLCVQLLSMLFASYV